MKINFTKKEYRLLVDMLEISEWVMNSHISADREETKKHSELTQKIYSYSKEAGCEDLLQYNKEMSEYYATIDYEESGLHMQLIDKFEDNVFWDTLSRQFAIKSLIEQEGEEAVEKMDFGDRALRLMELESKYDQEFSDHGLKNIKLDKNI